MKIKVPKGYIVRVGIVKSVGAQFGFTVHDADTNSIVYRSQPIGQNRHHLIIEEINRQIFAWEQSKNLQELRSSLSGTYSSEGKINE